MNDTIAAIATASTSSAISIIRVSGPSSIQIVNSIFKGRNLDQVPSHSITYGHIIDKTSVIDEVLVSVMRSPKSYTTEDTVEINTHGSLASTNKVLELLLLNGCRLAEPGEFTKRAFLNGRIDLIEAESVMNLINAKTEKTRQLALQGIEGHISELIVNLRNEILKLLANIEVNIDYPEYEDIKELTQKELLPSVLEIEKKVKTILKESENGKIINHGINVAIIGKPNVGKSSLLNTLLHEDKAIVTSIAGTTRDPIEGTIVLNGITLNLIDTAGIRKSNDIVEQIGVKRSKDIINKSDLVLYMLNTNEEINNEDQKLLNDIKTKKHIIIKNKIDLPSKLILNENNVIEMSITNNKGIDELKNRIIEMFNLKELETKDPTYISSARAVSLLKEALISIEDTKNGINNLLPIDMIEIDLKNVWNKLGSIIGEVYEDELINQLFSQFCLGK